MEIHDQKRHRAVGLGLQNEATVEFQRRAEQGRQHDRLAEQLADGRRLIVPCQDIVLRGAQTGRGSRLRETVSWRGIVKSWPFIWGRGARKESAEFCSVLRRPCESNAKA